MRRRANRRDAAHAKSCEVGFKFEVAARPNDLQTKIGIAKRAYAERIRTVWRASLLAVARSPRGKNARTMADKSAPLRERNAPLHDEHDAQQKHEDSFRRFECPNCHDEYSASGEAG